MAKKNGYKSQDVIISGGSMANTGGCTGGTEVKITYDNAARKRMTVTGNKTIRGIGKSGVIKGKGLMLDGDNIILQNIHITELNPHVVWGGDAIFMQGKQATTPLNKIWLDHIKVSRVGRQMVVTNKAGVASMTISNSDFDGNTEYSATCDGHHYWTFLFYGKNTGVSMLNNYVHGTSGRSPKIGGNPNERVVVHVANNYWGNNTGHSFELGANGYVLAEGNYFDNTKQPLFAGSDGSLYAATNSDECSKYLGRSCAANTLVDSGTFASRNGGNALKTIKGVSTVGSNKATTTLNKIWIDHVKVSHVGRQMVVTNKAGVATLTISNSDFDGNTEYSATCDGHHYWTFLFYGKNTGVSMLNNYVHSTSGRSPKVGGNPNEHVVVHVANNQWGNNSGHSFELGINAYVLPRQLLRQHQAASRQGRRWIPVRSRRCRPVHQLPGPSVRSKRSGGQRQLHIAQRPGRS
ncbi:ubiquitin-specific protease 2A [Phytophthora nicotianae]|uniref:pectin lyase n=1 Tax=Phytophthora nicotianae TaxID=4792 RepID=A0A0W8DR89_PHYNI|nr:ubiquitin-specific protease 2A [Phytophthora nicotianae]